MTTVLASAGLILLTLLVVSCLWPPKASAVTNLLWAVGAILIVTMLVIAIGFIIIVLTISLAILLGAGLPIPEWPREAVAKAKTRLLRTFRHGA
jgi:hypothetical protein